MGCQRENPSISSPTGGIQRGLRDQGCGSTTGLSEELAVSFEGSARALARVHYPRPPPATRTRRRSMPYPPESRKPSTEAEVLDGARCYANARLRAEVLHRKRTLAVEAENLAACDFHDASNERFNANLEAGDRAMGFTTPVDPLSGVGGVDGYPTGKAHLAYERHLAARKRLDAECDQADRELEETLEVLLTAASGLVEDTDGPEEHGSDDEGLNLLVGGGATEEAESNDSGDAGVNEVAPAA